MPADCRFSELKDGKSNERKCLMPYVNVRITEDGVTAEQKRQVISEITDVLVRVLGKSPDSTFVVIDEVSPENWGFKGTSIAELRKR
jgi:4-oxalocrotonate tautomerase